MDIYHWLSDQTSAMTDLTLAWAAQNSGSTNTHGLTAMAGPIVEAFTTLPVAYTQLAAAPVTAIDDLGREGPAQLGPVHRFTCRPDAPRRVILTGHLDTVYPADHPFQSCTWLDEDTVSGPGVADMKGGLVVMLYALKALERSDLADKPGWDVLISSDEEIGSLGSAPHLAEAAKAGQIGLTYEPSLPDGALAGARKGSGNFTLVVTGRAAHAGREFASGRSAVVALAEAVLALHRLNGQRDGVTINTAILRGGTAPNIVPDHALCRFNIRVVTAEDRDWAQDALDRIVADLNRKDGIAGQLHGGFNRPPKPLSAANRRLMEAIAACGRDLGLAIDYRDTGGVCEGNNLAAAGLPNVDTLGVRGAQIHSPEEYMIVSSLPERAALSYAVLHAFGSGRFDAWL
ncbi:MAG: hydrolase [Rhodothalassiaceae bacterium]